jgi:hypothetical protein
MLISGFGDSCLYEKLFIKSEPYANSEIKLESEANQGELTLLIDSTSAVFTNVDLPNTNHPLSNSYLELFGELVSCISSNEGKILLIDSTSILNSINLTLSFDATDSLGAESMETDKGLDFTLGSIHEQQEGRDPIYAEFDLEELENAASADYSLEAESMETDKGLDFTLGSIHEQQEGRDPIYAEFDLEKLENAASADLSQTSSTNPSPSRRYTRKPSFPKQSASTKKRHDWTKEEDKKLISLIKLYGNNWTEISQILSKELGVTRNVHQCSERWNMCLDPSISHKPWREEELGALERLVREFGEKKWDVIAKHLSAQKKERRTRIQCRNKWIDTIKHRSWNQEDNEKLTRLFAEHGTQWALITNNMNNLNSTTRTWCQYYAHAIFLKLL